MHDIFFLLLIRIRIRQKPTANAEPIIKIIKTFENH